MKKIGFESNTTNHRFFVGVVEIQKPVMGIEVKGNTKEERVSYMKYIFECVEKGKLYG